MSAPRDQPSNVATEDALRPPDQSVVTSDSPTGTEPPGDDSGKPAAAADSGGSNDQTPAPGDKQAAKPKRDRSSERRIKKLSQRLGAADDTTKAQARRIAELEDTVNTLKASTPKVEEPRLKDFDTPQAYAKAYSKWTKADQPAPAAPGKPTAPAKSAPDPQIEDTEVADFTKRGKEKLGDEFVEASQDKDNAVNAVMGEYMLDHDLGPEIYVHLSNNHKEARKIFDMVPHKAVKALDGLAAKAEKGELDVGEGGMKVADPPDTGDSDIDPKKTPAGSGGSRPGETKAPKPPSGTKGGSATPEKSAEDEDMDEYAARRQRETRRAQGLPPL